MLALNFSAFEPDPSLPPQRRRGGAIVWQPHYEGFTTIAYRNGRAIAGISGPWSQQYVLIWWQAAQRIREVEVFDSLEDAKAAVAQEMIEPAGRLRGAVRVLCEEPLPLPLPGLRAAVSRWLQRFARRPGATRGARLSREDTDLSGLNFPATR